MSNGNKAIVDLLNVTVEGLYDKQKELDKEKEGILTRCIKAFRDEYHTDVLKFHNEDGDGDAPECNCSDCDNDDVDCYVTTLEFNADNTIKGMHLIGYYDDWKEFDICGDERHSLTDINDLDIATHIICLLDGNYNPEGDGIRYFCPICGHEFVQGESNYNYDTAHCDFQCPDCDWCGTEVDCDVKDGEEGE